MNQFIFQIAFWIFSAGLCLFGKVDLGRPTFSKPHAPATTAKGEQPLLHDIDVMNPLFIFK